MTLLSPSKRNARSFQLERYSELRRVRRLRKPNSTVQGQQDQLYYSFKMWRFLVVQHWKPKLAQKRVSERLWRKLRDSNPGRTFTLAGFQDRCIRPLCQASAVRPLNRLKLILQNPLNVPNYAHASANPLLSPFLAVSQRLVCPKVPRTMGRDRLNGLSHRVGVRT